MSLLAGKIAVVTGAGTDPSGIGEAIALSYAAESAHVVVVDFDGDAAQRVVGEIVDAGGSASSTVFDRDVEDGSAHALDSLVTADRRIDVLCNRINVNVPNEDTDIVNVPLGTWDQIMDVNVRNVMTSCRAVIPAMVASGGGVIVNISSTSGSSPEPGNAAYAVSKAALNQLTRVIATRFGRDNIRCNAVAPGYAVKREAYTSSAEGRRMAEAVLRHHLTTELGSADDVATAVTFLSSDKARFVNGQIWLIDGGLLSHVPYFADALDGWPEPVRQPESEGG